MLEAGAVWLAPGLGHPVFRRFAAFFGTLFRRFEAIDYRAVYLERGGRSLQASIASALGGKPDLLIYTQFPSSYAYIAPATLSRVRGGARLVGLGFDDEIYFEQAKHFYLRCDAVITSDIEDAGRLSAAGISVHFAQLQQPADSAPAGGATIPEDVGVSFVGDMTKPGRREFVAALVDAGIAVADYGKGSRHGTLSDAEVTELFRRSRINLNFTRTNPPAWILRNDPARAAVGQIKGRPFDLAALGRFCLCEYAPCVPHWFRPEQEIGVFRDPRELVAAVRRYEGDDALRRRIASAAHDRYRAQYEPHRHFEHIFSDILARPPRATAPSPPAPDSMFYESMGRSRAIAFLHAVRGGRPLRALGETLGDAARRARYWRGFAGGLKDTLTAELARR